MAESRVPSQSPPPLSPGHSTPPVILAIMQTPHTDNLDAFYDFEFQFVNVRYILNWESKTLISRFTSDTDNCRYWNILHYLLTNHALGKCFVQRLKTFCTCKIFYLFWSKQRFLDTLQLFIFQTRILYNERSIYFKYQ